MLEDYIRSFYVPKIHNSMVLVKLLLLLVVVEIPAFVIYCICLDELNIKMQYVHYLPLLLIVLSAVALIYQTLNTLKINDLLDSRLHGLYASAEINQLFSSTEFMIYEKSNGFQLIPMYNTESNKIKVDFFVSNNFRIFRIYSISSISGITNILELDERQTDHIFTLNILLELLAIKYIVPIKFMQYEETCLSLNHK